MTTDYRAVTRVPAAGDDHRDWKLAGLCRRPGVPHDLHHPDGYGQRHRGQVDEAKAMCLQCPARAACLQFALDRDERWGIYGATTPGERAALAVARPQRPAAARQGGAPGLTPATVAEIRARWVATPRITQDALAAHYRVSRTAIGMAVRGETWKQVPA